MEVEVRWRRRRRDGGSKVIRVDVVESSLASAPSLESRVLKKLRHDELWLQCPVVPLLLLYWRCMKGEPTYQRRARVPPIRVHGEEGQSPLTKSEIILTIVASEGLRHIIVTISNLITTN